MEVDKEKKRILSRENDEESIHERGEEDGKSF